MTQMAYCACGFRTRDTRDWHEHVVGANHTYHHIITRGKRNHLWLETEPGSFIYHCLYCTASTFDPQAVDEAVKYNNAPRCWEDKL